MEETPNPTLVDIGIKAWENVNCNLKCSEWFSMNSVHVVCQVADGEIKTNFLILFNQSNTDNYGNYALSPIALSLSLTYTHTHTHTHTHIYR